MRAYKLDFGWEMDFPRKWIQEADDNGVYIFYPPNDSATVYATVFTANSQGIPAPEEVLEEFFVKSLAEKNAEEIPFSVDSLGCRAFFCVDDNEIFRISVGVFTEGNLLSLNVYAESEDMVYKVSELFGSVRFNGGYDVV